MQMQSNEGSAADIRALSPELWQEDGLDLLEERLLCTGCFLAAFGLH
jgi:hypothetical protein